MPMRTRIVTVLFVALTVVAVAALWWIGRSTDERRQAVEGNASSQPIPTPSAVSLDQKPAREEDARAQPAEHKMSNLEFNRLKVDLPVPTNKPWKASVFNSDNYLDPERKEMVVEVLPGWIRRALKEGKRDLAARFLWSLQTLTNDDDHKVSSEAVLGIYRLGDLNGKAAARMRDWISSAADFRYSDSTTGSTSKDIRAQVLEELELNNDRSLDQSIYDTWLRNHAAEGKDVAAVDYAYYLAKHGRELSGEYWAQRLDSPYGFERALEIAEQKAVPEVTGKLQSIFEELRARPATTPDANRAASVAAALFRQTGDGRYRDYLAEQARAQLSSASFESNLPKVLQGLAATNDKSALEIVSTATQHDNEMVREMAIDALGKSRDPAAAELLFEAAIQKAKQGKSFPAREMRALLAQDDPSADSKYERLQQALLSGQLGWSATTSDFEALEFFRKHGRQ
jgi:HEAT repeats